MRVLYMLAAMFAVVADLNASQDQARQVLIAELISSPHRFDGKQVSVVGFFDGTDPHGGTLRISATSSSTPRIFLDLSPAQGDELTRKGLLRCYLKVVGIFQHRDLKPKTARDVPEDPIRTIVKQPQGFSWGYANQITHIAELKPASLPK